MLESADAEVMEGAEASAEAIFQRALRDLPFNVQIPRSKLEALGKSGPAATTLSDQRRHVRFRQLKRGIVRCEPTFPSIQRSTELSLGLVVTISKEGVGLLYPMQLYPKERFALRMEGSGLMRLTVARCRKLGPNCFEIGASSATPIDVKRFITG